MSAPKRIQMSRQHPWRAENPDVVRVDRTTIYGNPFRVSRKACDERGHCWVVWRGYADYEHFDTKRDAATEAVEMFRTHTAPGLTLDGLRDQDMACWCPLDQPCHADVLLELANKQVTA